MSALTCGCDPEAHWICEEHRNENVTVPAVDGVKEHVCGLSGIGFQCPACEAYNRYVAPLEKVSASEQFRREAVAAAHAMQPRVEDVKVIDAMQKKIETQQAVIDDLVAERNRIAYVLRTLYYAELTLSNLQPVIALAIELNPDIMEKRR